MSRKKKIYIFNLKLNKMLFTFLITVGFVILVSIYYNKIVVKIKHFWYNNKYINDKLGRNTKKNFAFDKVVLADTLEKCEYAVQHIQRYQ